MAREAETERLRKLVDIAEDMGFRVWFDFKQCHIHEMYGKEVAWFDLGDQNRFWVDGAFLVAAGGRYLHDICGILKEFAAKPGRQSRGTLYAIRGTIDTWSGVKELPDASGIERIDGESLCALYTIKGARRIVRRYDIGKANIVAVEDKDYEGLGAYNHDESKDEEKPNSPIENKPQPPAMGPTLDEHNNNNFFRTDF